MSHGHRTLVLSLVGVLVLLGVIQFVERSDAGSAEAGNIAPVASISETGAVVSEPLATASTTAVSTATSTVPVPSTVAPTTTTFGAADSDCPATARGAVIDRARQRAYLCADGKVTYGFPITTAQSQPDPGTYPVYAKDLNASSNFGGHYSTMTHFVAFTRGKYAGARIAFHSVPKLTNGDWVQPLDSVGSLAMFGESSGCIRVLPDDAVKIWDFLQIDDEVRVIS